MNGRAPPAGPAIPYPVSRPARKRSSRRMRRKQSGKPACARRRLSLKARSKSGSSQRYAFGMGLVGSMMLRLMIMILAGVLRCPANFSLLCVRSVHIFVPDCKLGQGTGTGIMCHPMGWVLATTALCLASIAKFAVETTITRPTSQSWQRTKSSCGRRKWWMTLWPKSRSCPLSLVLSLPHFPNTHPLVFPGLAIAPVSLTILRRKTPVTDMRIWRSRSRPGSIFHST